MSLNPVLPSSGSQQPSLVAKPGGGGATVTANDGGGGVADTVRLSDQGKMMSRLAARIAPTPENVRKLSTALASDLTTLFRQNGIDMRRDIGFDVGFPPGKISISAGRSDAPTIAGTIERQPSIEDQMNDIAVLSRQVFAAEQDADARLANRLAKSAALISSVVSDYASRFGNGDDAQDFSPIAAPPAAANSGSSSAIANYTAISGNAAAPPRISLVFNDAGIQIHANGKPWISSRA